MGERDTVALLAAWGEWTRVGIRGLGANNPMLAIMAQAGCNNVFSDPDISDTDALRVDRAVAQLGLRSKFWMEVLKQYFVHMRSMRELEIQFKLSKFTMAKEFAGACGWVDCYLFGDKIEKNAA